MANKRKQANKADVQSTELNKMPVVDAEFAEETPAADRKKRGKR